MAQGREIGQAPFELDKDRTQADGKRRTTPDSVRKALGMLVEAELWQADSDLLSRRMRLPMGGEVHDGTFVDLATLCDPSHLGTNWPTGMLEYMGLMAKMPPAPES